MIQHELLRILRGRMTNAIVAFIAIGFAGQATALCVDPKEGGRWWNTNPQGDPISLEVTLDECGDQVLNGEQTETSYGLMVFVQQSNGSLYQRPKAKGFRKTQNGKTWLHASVPTGGYVDQIWLHRNDVNGQERLYVYVKHESLDSKPSAESKYWFSRQRVARPNTTLAETKGKSIANANPLVAAIRASEPDGLRRTGFDIGMGMWQGHILDGPGKKSFAQALTPAELEGFSDAATFSFQWNNNTDLAAKGALIALKDPEVAAARARAHGAPPPGLSAGLYWLGFDIATGIFGNPKLGALGNTELGPGSAKIRGTLGPDGQKGFNDSFFFNRVRR